MIAPAVELQSRRVTVLSVLRLFLAVLATALVTPVGVVISLIAPRTAWLFMVHTWSRLVLWIVGVRWHIRGGEHLAGPAIFIANHESLLDAPLLPAILPHRFVGVGKKELRRIPGWAIALRGGVIFADRQHHERAVKAVHSGIDKLPNGWSVLIFPEGTRTRSGVMGKFRKGVFHIALQTGLPVVPIGTYGPYALAPGAVWATRPGTVEIEVGAPITTQHWTREECDARMAELREAVVAQREAAKNRFQAAPVAS